MLLIELLWELGSLLCDAGTLLYALVHHGARGATWLCGGSLCWSMLRDEPWSTIVLTGLLLWEVYVCFVTRTIWWRRGIWGVLTNKKNNVRATDS